MREGCVSGLIEFKCKSQLSWLSVDQLPFEKRVWATTRGGGMERGSESRARAIQLDFSLCGGEDKHGVRMTLISEIETASRSSPDPGVGS